ncbi:Per1-like protein [Atractiella rhizophila]|nr:Per1-like protein [Atractiella rhizophila]
MRNLQPIPAFLLLLSLIPVAFSSVGDRSIGYRKCHYDCERSCRDTRFPRQAKIPRFWSCDDDCHYECQQKMTEIALIWKNHERAGLPLGRMTQFYGKWPLKRWRFVQEPMSTLFSIGNLLVHIAALMRLRRTLPASSESLRRLRNTYIGLSYVGINTWVWSIVFHTRDTRRTERLDYFSASLGTIYAFYLCVSRTNRFHFRSSQRVANLWKLACLVLFGVHTSILTFAHRFPYGYNMKFNLIVAGLTLARYVWWYLSPAEDKKFSLYSRPRSSPMTPAPPSPLPPLLVLAALTGLEMLEFQPWPTKQRLFDAHSLWHLSTIPVVWWWARYLEKDAEWEWRWEETEGGVRGLSRRSK